MLDRRTILAATAATVLARPNLARAAAPKTLRFVSRFDAGMAATSRRPPDPRAPAIGWAEAEAMLRRSEERFMAGEVAPILARYDTDVTIHFADLPPIRGLESAERFLQARFARQRDYRLRKSLVCVQGLRYVNTWTETWSDRLTGKPMEGFGIEALELGRGKLTHWETAFNVWEAGHQHAARYFDMD